MYFWWWKLFPLLIFHRSISSHIIHVHLLTKIWCELSEKGFAIWNIHEYTMYIVRIQFYLLVPTIQNLTFPVKQSYHILQIIWFNFVAGCILITIRLEPAMGNKSRDESREKLLQWYRDDPGSNNYLIKYIKNHNYKNIMAWLLDSIRYLFSNRYMEICIQKIPGLY